MKFHTLFIYTSEEECKSLLTATWKLNSGMILGLRQANDRRHYKVTASLIGSVQT